jgi:DnaJ-class molecular chaperone
MSQDKTIVCPNCRGKGHVLVGASLLGGPVIWVCALFEGNDADGISRGVCQRCRGKGFVCSPMRRAG